MKLSKPAMALTFAATVSLVACGADEYGQENGEYNGNTGSPIGYNQTSNQPSTDRDNNNEHTRQINNNDEYMFDDRTNRGDGKNADVKNNYEVADKAADQIASKIEGIDRAYVITTDNNAYVAATWDKENNGELTDKVKDKIAKTVKSVNKDIDNVYVSTNPDFFELAGQYSNDIESGQPVEGFFNQMGNMIERIFPANEEYTDKNS
ncbi:YhcN/YlaJ family sporulation lipoprotein [Gracilibacillus caseinilyticus]|uniref:YhcN/YlaJ family sporulation lipoprotein n=1 Tax=Gracilibacillus caseinilyticus TaxID=2932256 RepID=A0ABY4EQN3_9BACI|nr:YhcN/YlaJ family sporulation lipoprotein [Gracilibacillus caseinilyticus]UOQ46747.1 YhcN/YlaJ family sporulation lipoprotein [Gracilibacillus caseinilyticus]